MSESEYDDTDMSAEEFWATEATGIPVQIVTSRAEYERRLPACHE